MKIGISLTSSLHVGDEYIELTRLIAKTLAEKGHSIVYGGTAYGMMLELAETYKKAGGTELIGIMSKDLIAVTKGYEAYPHLDQTIMVDTIGERKDRIISTCDAMLILPGGYGTIEELITVAGGKINKLLDKPIAVYNYKNFYGTLTVFFQELCEKKFSKIDFSSVVYDSTDLETILQYFINYRNTELADKFI